MSSNGMQRAHAELRELIDDGGIDPERFRALALAGVLNEKDSGRLLAQRRAYNNAPQERRIDGYWFSETTRYKRKSEKLVLAAVGKAVREGNLSMVNFILGIVQREGASRDFVEMKKLERYLSKDGRLIVFGGQMGNGKTNASLRICEFYKEIHPNVRFASNIPSWLEADTVTGVEELEDWIDEHEEDKKAVVLDEMSSKTAHSTHGKQVKEQLAGLIRTMRHSHVDLMIVIGHRIQDDIHPSIHKLAHIAYKHEVETLTMYEQMAGDEPVDQLFQWDLAETTMVYDTHEDDTPWEWKDPEDEDAFDWEATAQRIALDLYRDNDVDLSMQDIADLFDAPGVSRSTISRMHGGTA